MKTALKHLILLFLFTSISIYANDSKSNLVDIAKDQRVLSQKIAKSYLLLAYGANLAELKSELKASIFLFENNLDILRVQTPNHFSRVASEIISKEASVWYTFKANIENTPTKDNLNTVVELANGLLKKAHLAYTAMRTELQHATNYTVDTNLDKLLKISEKQEILSQRLCLYFVAQKINITSNKQNPKILGTLRSIVEKLDRQLIILLETNVNSSETVKIIDNALIAFEDIRTNKTDFLNGKPSMNTIYTTTKQLNKLFKILATEYSQLAAL